MALPIRLYGNFISVKGAASIQGLLVSDSDLQFGVVSGVPKKTREAKKGDSVLFRASQAVMIKGDTDYFLVKDTDIILIENPVT